MVQLIGVLPTYRRPETLATTLNQIVAQTRPLDLILVVDNEANRATEEVVRTATSSRTRIEYLAPPSNLGFAGGVGFGMRHALQLAADDDWIVLLDDDDPPRFPDAIELLEGFAEDRMRFEPKTAAVGLSGGWFDWKRGRMRRIPDGEIVDAVPVDHVAGNQLPFFRVAAVRAVGPFDERIFFGLSELEFGLRLWRAGFRLWGYGPLWIRGRELTGRLNRELAPSRRLPKMDWRRYYTLRNLIYLLRKFDHRATALRVTFVVGMGKPLLNLPVSPRLALQHLRVNLRALRDGWTGRMGRRVEPDGARRADKAEARIGT
jgi:glycosyltransferase involved in cell wall biosynthesis